VPRLLAAAPVSPGATLPAEPYAEGRSEGHVSAGGAAPRE
jgi:hypothetical protein